MVALYYALLPLISTRAPRRLIPRCMPSLIGKHVDHMHPKTAVIALAAAPPCGNNSRARYYGATK